MRTLNIISSFLFIILLSSVVISCTKSTERTSPRQQIEVLRERNIIIKSIEKIDNGIVIFSDKDKQILFIPTRVSLITIGLDGYWYQDGSRTRYRVEEDSIEDLVPAHGLEVSEITAISEDYTHWEFHFGKHESVLLNKAVSKDFEDKMVSINHRGYCTEAPENTLPAYRLSRLKGFSYVETDIRFTSDGVPVLLHDVTIDRTSDGIGKLCELTFAEIKKYDFGQWKSLSFASTQIPSLQEFLSLCYAINLKPVLELKEGTEEQIKAIIDLVEYHHLKDDVRFISFSSALLKRVMEIDPKAKIGLLVSEVTSKVVEQAVDLKTAENSIVINSSDYCDNAIEMCKNADLPLWVWTIDSEIKIRSLNPYITGVTSNCIHAGRLLYDN